MIVDGSYMAWVRPTRRVHLALSVGMTLTGAILILAGASGGPGPERTAPSIGRTADGVASGPNDTAGTMVPPAPLVHFAPPPLTSLLVPPPTSPLASPPGLPHAAPPHPGAAENTAAKPHTKPKPHPRHTPHPSDLSHPEPHPAPRPEAPTPPPSRAPLPPPSLKR